MAIRRQNRTIWILAAVVFFVLLTFLIRDGRLEDFFRNRPNEGATDKAPVNEEQYGEKVTESFLSGDAEDREQFKETLDRMVQCFQIPNAELESPIQVEIETVYRKLQSSFGPETHQADRWMAWHLRTRDGRERRLRLEITETDTGKVGRELHYFDVDRDGQPTPIELDPERAMNPTDDVISQMLKEGEVFYKERAAVSFFADGNRIEFIDKDGELAEMLVYKGDKQFRCADVTEPENCQCL